MLTSEICYGYSYYESADDSDKELREKHPGLKTAYDEYTEAKHKYEMLLKLVKVTDKF